MEVDMKVKNYTKVNSKNLKELYNNPKGNIYVTEDGKTYEVVDGFELYEIREAMLAGFAGFIYIEGPSLGTNVELAD